jgi:hypothetical protein
VFKILDLGTHPLNSCLNLNTPSYLLCLSVGRASGRSRIVFRFAPHILSWVQYSKRSWFESGSLIKDLRSWKSRQIFWIIIRVFKLS